MCVRESPCACDDRGSAGNEIELVIFSWDPRVGVAWWKAERGGQNGRKTTGMVAEKERDTGLSQKCEDNNAI